MTTTRNWSITPWTRRVLNDRYEWVGIEGAAVTDRDTGLVYHVTVGTSRGGAWLTHLSIGTTEPEQRINHDVLTKVPTKALADTVAQHLRDAEGVATFNFFNVRVPGDKPTLADLAAQYGQRTRQDLATHYAVSPSTIDRWVAEARSQGLIPPAKTGRPRTRPTENTP